jgi:hypothetical protein
MIDFGLWAECENEASLYKFKEHFDGLQHTLLTGRTITFRAGIDDSNVVCGLSVGSTQLLQNGRGIENLKDALEVTEAGIVLYHRLKTAPDFRFVHIDWNAEGTTSEDLSECVETMSDGKRWLNVECALNDKLYKQLGSPVSLRQFREGYWWRKYRGETYMPLFSTDQKELRDLSERLLPDT